MLGMIPDIVAAAIIAMLSGEGLAAFAFAFVALYVIYFLIWVKNSIWEWIVFSRYKKSISEQYLEFFKKNNYPEPDEYINTGSDWLLGISENKDYAADLRVSAAVECGALSAMRLNGHMQRFLRASIALDDAIEAYKKTFLKKEQGDVG
jgi:hypothetical protein